ncbi:F-box only protein 40-like [Corythoichthys intestinalis]|uniref:F-box only protein 40-like n=1 Tax=Corythoichthys intestinalis TaxID=161448 RepID=UPI0025A59D63|nr:F-box only protein 40-like [Corythoichthys intestinalis]
MHTHCGSCYSTLCRAQVEAGVCCAVVACRLRCGALFHSCKEEGHLLLCPCVRVPCLNFNYGCPAQLPRAQLAAHLRACPASAVVCCVEWNRWPANDAHSYPSPELYSNLMRECKEGLCKDLDLAMALKDQMHLFRSLKMKELFPELTQFAGEEENKRREEEKKKQEEKKKAALEKESTPKTWESFSPFHFNITTEKDDEEEEEEELTQQEREALARKPLEESQGQLDHFSAWESMFSMAMGGCREAGKGNQQDAGEAGRPGGVTEAAVTHEVSPLSPSNVEKDTFRYDHVEPMKIVAVRTFKVPSSFSAKQGRIRNPGFYKRDNKAVDTADLPRQDMPVWEEVQASLLCSLEKEQRGHLIAEKICTDGLLQDEGTQTFQFLSAPFASAASLADLTAGREEELHLQLQLESVSNRHHKASSAFTAVCGHTVHRREYASHYKNVHSDIQTNVNGWFQQRCPLAYLGCTFSQTRFTPSTHQAAVVFTEDLGCFQLRPVIPASGSHAPSCDALSSLPFELLCHVATFLDSLSLSQLALVSHLMRQVCSTLLPTHGIVSLRWEKVVRPGGRIQWSAQNKVWHFSSSFSEVDRWKFRDIPSMSEHLRLCPFYQRESRNDRVLLPDIECKRQCEMHSNNPH